MAMHWSRENVLKYVIGMEQLSRRTQRTLAHLSKTVKIAKKNIASAKCTHCKQRMRPKPVKNKANPAKRLARISGDMPIQASEAITMDVTTDPKPMPTLIPETLIPIPPMPMLNPETLIPIPPSATRMPKLTLELPDRVVTNPKVVKRIVTIPKQAKKVLSSPKKVMTNPGVVTKVVPEVQQTTPPTPTMGFMTRVFLNKKNGDSGIDMDEDQCSVSIKVRCWLEDTSTEPSPDLEKEMDAVASRLGMTPLQIGIATKRERFFDTIVHEDKDDESLNVDEFINFKNP